jgi:hypothetical protein
VWGHAVRESKFERSAAMFPDFPQRLGVGVEAVDQLDSHRIFRELRFRARGNRS